MIEITDKTDFLQRGERERDMPGLDLDETLGQNFMVLHVEFEGDG